MYKTLRVLIGFAVLCLAQNAQAQNIGNTPYSRYGLGELNYNLGGIRNAGMGGTGVSAGNSFQINTANPALLYYNNITIFDMGIAGQVKTLNNGNQSQTDGDANLANITLGVPLSKRWTSAISLRPYSSMDYEINGTAESLPGAPAAVQRMYSGEGGLSEINFGHGFRVAGGLTIGASASYIFGNLTQQSSSYVQDTTLSGLNTEMLVYSERTRYSNFLFRAGANYRKKITDKFNLSAGAVYSFQRDWSANYESSYQRRSIYDEPVGDEILTDSTEGSVNMPPSLRVGVSVDNGSNLTVAADFYTQNWSEFRTVDGKQDLADSYRIGAGAEYTPNANAIDSYFKRITYRGGLYYENTPYQVNGEQIIDKGVTAGFTLPIGMSTIYDMYQLNLAFAYGQRGNTDNGLIKENYLKFNVGVTINSRWFIKRRLE